MKQETPSPDTTRLTASQMTSGKADLVVGTCAYHPCGHKFAWILDHHLRRVGRRSPDTHACPACSAQTCLVCLGPFDASKSDTCPGCDQFFVRRLLPARREALTRLNLVLADDTPGAYLRARIEFEKMRFRERWGCLPGEGLKIGRGGEE
ncbi:hypothetical protein GGS20DRAFT_588836 [Poronia punctata]|nr:hypothetical protein GGS20DRAFT_588836 [Poronia punctata]